MRLMLNGETMEINVATLAELVAVRASDPATPVATAVNGVFVDKARRQTFILSPGDAVELLTPMQGG